MGQEPKADNNGEAGPGISDIKPQTSHQEMLERYKTAQSVVIPREVFEELYLEPSNGRKPGRLGTIFGNPTPMYVAQRVLNHIPEGTVQWTPLGEMVTTRHLCC